MYVWAVNHYDRDTLQADLDDLTTSHDLADYAWPRVASIYAIWDRKAELEAQSTIVAELEEVNPCGEFEGGTWSCAREEAGEREYHLRGQDGALLAVMIARQMKVR